MRRTAGRAAAAAMIVLTACGGATSNPDATYDGVQARGETAMGVDQDIAQHRFDVLEDGGRVELQWPADDAREIATIRAHLQEIVAAFRVGDFSTPAFVHAQPVPGTDVMAAKGDAIRYEYRELPRGGEVLMTTADAEAQDAIRHFMHFQRGDHRAGGHGH
jgi:hypothetical protein